MCLTTASVTDAQFERCVDRWTVDSKCKTLKPGSPGYASGFCFLLTKP